LLYLIKIHIKNKNQRKYLSHYQFKVKIF